jgi:hypothetical protein
VVRTVTRVNGPTNPVSSPRRVRKHACRFCRHVEYDSPAFWRCTGMGPRYHANRVAMSRLSLFFVALRLGTI